MLEQIAYVSQIGREVFHNRVAIVEQSKEELGASLNDFLSNVENSNIHFGKDKDSDEVVELTSETQVTEAFINDLAARWAKGSEAEFSKLYTVHQPRKVELPGYPFARKEYWIPIAEGKTDAEGLLHQSQQLLHSQVQLSFSPKPDLQHL